MTFTIDLTPTEEAQLMAGAKQSGMVPEEFLKRLVTEHLPQGIEMTFGEILAPVHQYRRQQADTEEELGDFADSEVVAYRAERRMKPDPSTDE